LRDILRNVHLYRPISPAGRSASKDMPAFYRLKCSLPYSQQPATLPYREPVYECMYQFHCFQSACVASLQVFPGVFPSSPVPRLGSGFRRQLRCPRVAASSLIFNCNTWNQDILLLTFTLNWAVIWGGGELVTSSHGVPRTRPALPPERPNDLRDSTVMYSNETYYVLLPVRTVATAIKAMCRYCGRVFGYDWKLHSQFFFQLNE
jgi:hypothetical protein